MSNVKRYSVALVLGTLAALFFVTFGLAFTVWAPEKQIEASGESNRPFVMTRTGVLSLYPDVNGEVVVTVTGATAEDSVWLAVGTAEDILAWIDNRPYDEVVGLENLKTLKFVEVPAVEETQSGEAEVNQQTDVERKPSDNPLASDMWISLDEGVGTLTKTIPSGLLDKSVLVASDGVSVAPTLTLSWETTKTNLVAWLALTFAIIATFLTVLSAWGTFRRQRRRKLRAERLRQSFSADSTQTAMIPAVSAAEEIDTVGGEPEPVQIPVSEENIDEIQPEPELEPEPEAQPLSDPDESAGGDDSAPETDPDLSESGNQVFSPLDVAGTVEEAEPADVSESMEKTGVDTETADPIGKIDERVETISTDSGMINLSALQGGGVFPTRRALREAETRGIGRVIVEGHEFVTGSQPVITTSTTNDNATDAASEVLGKRSSRGSQWRDAFSGWKGRSSAGGVTGGSVDDSADPTRDEKEGSSE